MRSSLSSSCSISWSRLRRLRRASMRVWTSYMASVQAATVGLSSLMADPVSDGFAAGGMHRFVVGRDDRIDQSLGDHVRLVLVVVVEGDTDAAAGGHDDGGHVAVEPAGVVERFGQGFYDGAGGVVLAFEVVERLPELEVVQAVLELSRSLLGFSVFDAGYDLEGVGYSCGGGWPPSLGAGTVGVVVSA